MPGISTACGGSDIAIKKEGFGIYAAGKCVTIMFDMFNRSRSLSERIARLYSHIAIA